jgi:hypothetical protein
MNETIESQEIQPQKSNKKSKSDSNKSYIESENNTELTAVDSDIVVDTEISNKKIKQIDEAKIEAKIELKSKLSLLVHPTRATKKKPVTSLSKPRKGNVMVIGKAKNKSINFF